MEGKRKGLIIVNAYARLSGIAYQTRRLSEELLALGVEVEVRRNDGALALIDEGGAVRSRCAEYDFVIYLDKDKYMSALLEESGMRLFNSHRAICDCDDKMTTAIRLSGKGIPMPKTLAGPLCYTGGAVLSEELVERVISELGLPVVVKECYGSLGKEVRLARTREELRELALSLMYKPHLFQRFVASSAGRDIRVIAVGGRVVGAMRRESDTDFRSNIELGGRGIPHEPSDELVSLCERVARELGLDYCGIDIMHGEDGYLVCEVNSNAFFGGIESATGVNIARCYAEHIYSEIYGK